MDTDDVAEKPLQHIDMMAGLIGEHAAVIGPGATPGILVIIGLIAAPAHPHGAQNETTEPAGFERFAGLDHRNVESILLDDEHLDACFVAGTDHVVGILQPQRHRLLDDDMLAGLCAGDDMRSMHTARRQNRYRVDVLACEEIVNVVDCGNIEFRSDGVGARTNVVTNGGEAGPFDMIAAQKVGVALGDASTSEQAKSDHKEPCYS
jgi:hypothetical protein